MARPVKKLKVCRLPICKEFCGNGKKENGIILTVEEFETLRLIDYNGMSQAMCARNMNCSRATVQALYTEARKKVSRFLVEGTALCIEGGNYEIDPSDAGTGHLNDNEDQELNLKGDDCMKIAVTYENGQIFQHFGHTETFKIYEVEDGKIVSSEVVGTNGQGHGALGSFLAAKGVDVLICGGIGGGARNALAAAGIQLYGGACGDADVQVASYLAGTLAYNPNVECNHHGEGHGEGHNCGGHGEGHSCGGHGEGHHHGDGHSCCH